MPYFAFLKSRDVHAAVDLVRRRCTYAVAGNHDLYAVRKLPTIQRVFAYPADWYERDWPTRKAIANGRVWLYDDELPFLTKDDRQFLEHLPELLVITCAGLRILLSHYAYPDLTGDSASFDPAAPDNLRAHVEFMAGHGCGLGVSGHQGYGHDGLALHTADAYLEGFGVFDLPARESTWLQLPWVANSTYANGVVVLDASAGRVEALPLDSPPHTVPSWAEQ